MQNILASLLNFNEMDTYWIEPEQNHGWKVPTPYFNTDPTFNPNLNFFFLLFFIAADLQ